MTMEHPDTLRNTGSGISDLFYYVQDFVKNDVGRFQAISNELQRFELWATNLGLHHNGHSSLDYRLRDSVLVFGYTINLLRDLEQALQKFHSSLIDDNETAYDAQGDIESHTSHESEGLSEEDSDEEDLSSYQVEPPAEAFFRNIVSTIDKLYRLAFKIRNPSLRFGFTKSANYSQKDPETGRDLIDEYATFDIRHVEEVFRSYGASTSQIDQYRYLIERLAKANTRRRQQLLYWKHRRAKYQVFDRPQPKKTHERITDETFQEIPDLKPAHSASGISKPSTATWLNPQKVNLDDNASAISSSGTVFSISIERDSDKAIIPSPPALDPSAKEFECPFCFTMCPRKTIDKNAWKKHVFRDLRPYICTHKDCRDPDQQYDSLHDWIQHETSQHLSSSSTSQSHHGPQTQDCLFCCKKNIPLTHVAQHLRRIASFALPSLSGHDTTLGSLSEASGGARVDSDSTGGPSIGALSSLQDIFGGVDQPDPQVLVEDDKSPNLNPHSPVTASDELESQFELACTYLDTDQREQALTLLEELVTKSAKTFDEAHPRRLKYQHQLSKIYLTAGRPMEALGLLERVVAVAATTLDETDPSRLGYKHDLSNAYLSNGEFQLAAQLGENLVTIEQEVYGKDHPIVLESKHDLAIMYRLNDQRDQGIELLNEVLAARSKYLGGDHPKLSRTLFDLADMYHRHAQTQQAIKLLLKAVAIEERSSERLNERMGPHALLADCYEESGDTSKAVELCEHIVAMHEATSQEGNQDRLIALKRLAKAYGAQGRADKAIEVFGRVIKVEEKVLNKEHIQVLATHFKLATAYQQDGQNAKAIEVFEHVLAGRERTMDKNDPRIVASRRALENAKQSG